MRSILFLPFAALLSLFSCSVSRNANGASSKQGVQGLVEQVTGNQMPRMGREPDKPKPFPTTVFFYEPTNISQVNRVEQQPIYTAIYTKLVATAEVDSTGKFFKSLPPGTYSVFVQIGKQFFANSFDIRNNISLVTVVEGEVAEIKILVNHTASN